MARLSVNETTTFRWSFEEDVANYADAGIPAIGIWRQKLSDVGVAEGVRLLRQHDLQPSYLAWAGGFTGSDGRSFRESVEDAKEALQVAAQLQTRILIVYSGARAGHTHNHARRLIKTALEELAPVAAELDVVLAVEPMHPGCAAEWTFLTSADDAIRLLEEVNHPQVKMVFDTYHLGQAPDIVDRMSEIAPHVALVQLGDARQAPQGEQNRCRLGEGTLPLTALLAALSEAGYDGDYDVELLGEEFEAADYQSILEHAKEAFDKLVGQGHY